MKRILAAMLLSLAATPALAIQVEFQVPVELKNIDPSAVSVVVTCGQWWGDRYNTSASTTVPLRDAKTHKYYSGTVTVKLDFAGTQVPTGNYRCVMGMRTKGDFTEFTVKPAAVGTRAVVKVDGSFQEMQGLPRPQMQQPATKPAVKQPIQR